MKIEKKEFEKKVDRILKNNSKKIADKLLFKGGDFIPDVTFLLDLEQEKVKAVTHTSSTHVKSDKNEVALTKRKWRTLSDIDYDTWENMSTKEKVELIEKILLTEGLEEFKETIIDNAQYDTIEFVDKAVDNR